MTALMSISNEAARRFLDLQGHAGSVTRGLWRGANVPEDRRMDFLYRDVFMTLVMASIGEFSSRLTDNLFTAPQIAKLLRLRHLTETYQNKDVLYPQFNKIKDYTSLTEIEPLRIKSTGNLVKHHSANMIPANVAAELMKDKYKHFAQENEPLVLHLNRLLNFYNEHSHDGYLKILLDKNAINKAQFDRINMFWKR
jgi:hypothetical protein